MIKIEYCAFLDTTLIYGTEQFLLDVPLSLKPYRLVDNLGAEEAGKRSLSK